MAVVDVEDRGIPLFSKGDTFETIGECVNGMVTIKISGEKLLTISSCLFIQIGK